ncbi:hypothetical protein TrST_g12687 [Triparma strigata]|uniref:Uncharacterized protein n=1 Tax=Triparma strigata TaxID=1606541 RepID=A0A9W7BSR1_9STRA|nr:hypothetical protein TrST_g12687 [Triparma strigata]
MSTPSSTPSSEPPSADGTETKTMTVTLNLDGSVSDDSAPPSAPPNVAEDASTLVEKLLAVNFEVKHLQLISTLAFGNDNMKKAIASSPLIIKLIGFFTTASDPDVETTKSFCAALRACTINSAKGRAQCRIPELYVSFLKSLKSQPENRDECITTICAVCMNDEENCKLLKEAVGSVDLKDFVDDNEERAKKIKFLEALTE